MIEWGFRFVFRVYLFIVVWNSIGFVSKVLILISMIKCVG